MLVLTMYSRSRKIYMFPARTPRLSSWAPHGAGTTFGIACGIANSGSSVTLPPDIAHTCPDDSKRCRKVCRCLFSRRAVDRPADVRALEDNTEEYCTASGVCSDRVSPHL